MDEIIKSLFRFGFILYPISVFMVLKHFDVFGGWAAFWGALSIYGFYFGYLRSLHKQASEVQSDAIVMLTLNYLIISILIIMSYAWYYYNFCWVLDYNANQTSQKIDAFYFSTVTFTTLGFGDFAPRTPVEKLFVASNALLGSIVTLTFIAGFLAKIKQR